MTISISGNGWLGEAPKLYMQKEVERGMRLLYEYFDGLPWWERIDCSILDLSSTMDCILGQLFGSFDIGLLKLHLSGDEAPRCGFMVGETPWDFRLLDNSWLRALEYRSYAHGSLSRTWESAIVKLTQESRVVECLPA